MKIIYLSTMMLLLIACQANQQKPASSTAPAQPISADSLDEPADPAKEAEDPSLYAYGGAKFGMSTDEVLATEGFSGGTLKGETLTAPSDKSRVGNYKYNITASFHENKLYLVSIASDWKTAADIEFDLVALLNNLRDVISLRYGNPTQKNKMPNVMDFEPGGFRWVYTWQTGDKLIKAGMHESSDGAKYQAVMWIYNQPMFDKIGYNKANVNKVKDAARF